MDNAMSFIEKIYCHKATVPLVQRMRLKIELLQNSKITRLSTALNEVNLYRGSSPTMVRINCFVNNTLLTAIVSDGLLVASPTGSSAYSLSAGGPLVHPLVPSMILMPICPRSLSFRPAILPATAEITVELHPESRSNLQLSIDGSSPIDVPPDARIRITQSPHPLPVICREDATLDWISSINSLLAWNLHLPDK